MADNESNNEIDDLDYNHFLVDSLGDNYLLAPEDFEEADLENLVKALQSLGSLPTDTSEFSIASITKALQHYRSQHHVATGDLDTLYLEIGANIPLEVSDNAIRINMNHFDEAFQKQIQELIDDGDIEPFDFSNPADVDYFEQLKSNMRGYFSGVSEIVPGLTDDPSAEERKALNPEGRSFVMITPHDGIDGHNLFERLNRRAKWEAAKDALEDAGAPVTVIEGIGNGGGVREVYVRDRALTLGDVAYIPDPRTLIAHNFSYEDIYEYEKEAQQMTEFLNEQGYKVVKVEGAWFEGGNIVLHNTLEQNTLFLGMDNWTSQDSASRLINAINETQDTEWRMQGVPLTDMPDFYHLDLGMTYQLPNGEFIIYPGVTDDKTYQIIKDTVGAANIIEIDRETAALFVTNLNHVGNTIVLTDTTPEFEAMLEDRGYNVVSPDDYNMETFEFGRGGVHCITNEITIPSPG